MQRPQKMNLSPVQKVIIKDLYTKYGYKAIGNIHLHALDGRSLRGLFRRGILVSGDSRDTTVGTFWVDPCYDPVTQILYPTPVQTTPVQSPPKYQ